LEFVCYEEQGGYVVRRDDFEKVALADGFQSWWRRSKISTLFPRGSIEETVTAAVLSSQKGREGSQDRRKPAVLRTNLIRSR
jgi:hypothetical protein